MIDLEAENHLKLRNNKSVVNHEDTLKGESLVVSRMSSLQLEEKEVILPNPGSEAAGKDLESKEEKEVCDESTSNGCSLDGKFTQSQKSTSPGSLSQGVSFTHKNSYTPSKSSMNARHSLNYKYLSPLQGRYPNN